MSFQRQMDRRWKPYRDYERRRLLERQAFFAILYYLSWSVFAIVLIIWVASR